jgi:hypothetical protein
MDSQRTTNYAHYNNPNGLLMGLRETELFIFIRYHTSHTLRVATLYKNEYNYEFT